MNIPSSANTLTRILILCIGIIILTGCGQKGKLSLPEASFQTNNAIISHLF